MRVLPLYAFGAHPSPSGKGVLWVAVWFVLHSTCCAQWVISAIHPDPTPPLGAPDAEYVALLALGPSDSCLVLQGHELRWNGHARILPDGCWPTGSVLVVHRASDSAAFNFGDAIPLGLSSWPALVNGGGTVSLWDDTGRPLDAMPYDAAALGDGGQPLLRGVPDACGGRINQHSWSPEMDPFHHPWPEATQSALVWPSTDSMAQVAGHPERVVPRGPGQVDWYVGGGLDPASILQTKAWVGGARVDMTWRSDSVAQLSWGHRIRPFPSGDHRERVVQIGPLKGCGPGSRHRSFFGGWEPVRDFGRVEVVGVLPDPVPGDPERPEEALSIVNQEAEALELGPWSFGGGRLKRSTVLPALGEIRLEASAFEDWPGLPNAGGELHIASGSGRPLVELAWDPCDYSLPEHVGSGLGLERAAVAGAAWGTSGWTDDRPGETWSIKGYGCPTDFWGPMGLDVHLNRHVAQWPEVEWQAAGQKVTSVERIQGQNNGLRLGWGGMADMLEAPHGVEIEAWASGQVHAKLQAFCPRPVGAMEPPCLRIVEVMWNAHERASEYVEVMNCGGFPLELAGMQATTVQEPFPSDWRDWISDGVSLVLPPGGVAAFGPCDTWMANGLTEGGPSRWSVESWSALKDEAGQLTIRLPGFSANPLDEVVWGDWVQRPWWHSEDGWSWMRTSEDGTGWTPSYNRGSPGKADPIPVGGTCRDAVDFDQDREGGGGALNWRFPDAGGKMAIRIVHWPSGTLLDEVLFERPLTEGRWTWDGGGSMSLGHGVGHLVLEVRWWSASCRGRRLFRADMPWKG